jgi:sec-independent protein translocase protein TatC
MENIVNETNTEIIQDGEVTSPNVSISENPIAPSVDESEEFFFSYYKNSKYYDYLDEIRRKIFQLVIVFSIFFLGGFLLTAPILKYIVKFFQIQGVTIVTNSPFQFLDLAMNTGLIVALIFCAPLFVWFSYNFLKDGFNKREKNIFLILLPVTLVLFLVGFFYGFAILYFCLQAIAQVNINIGIQNLWDIDKYFSQIVLTSVLLGFIFEYPVVLTFLLKLKVIKISFLQNNRRYAIAIIFVFVSLLPPTDGLSLIIMALPLMLIYELTIFFNSFVRIKE